MPDVAAAFKFMREQYFGGARVRFESGFPKVVNVATTATQLMQGNPQRVGWAIVNKGTTPAHADYSRNVSTTRGFPVAQQGGTVTSKYTDVDGGDTVQSEIWAIAETSADDFYVVSWELY